MELSNTPRRKILICTDWFEPGYKAGGPIRSCYHFALNMHPDYDVYVFTSSHDLNEKEPYPGITPDKWLTHKEGFNVFYASPEKLSWQFILWEINNVAPGFLYLNSMFSIHFTIYPLLMKRMGKIKTEIVLAPRGMLKPSALQIKPAKKKIFLQLFKLLGLDKLIRFHATDAVEKNDLVNQFGRQTNITVLSNFASPVHDYNRSILKRKGELQIVFISRIHPIKNLDYLLLLLARSTGNITLTICGSREDDKYTRACERIIGELPANITVAFVGEVANHLLPGIMHQHHILALPTKGENFGHVIFEALAIGVPVLISDQTPWRQLTKDKAGWDVPLIHPEEWISIIHQLVEMEQEEYDQWSYGAWKYAKKYVTESDLKENYFNLFQ